MDLIQKHRKMLRKHNFDDCNIGGFSFKDINERDDFSCSRAGTNLDNMWKMNSEVRPVKMSDSLRG